VPDSARTFNIDAFVETGTAGSVSGVSVVLPSGIAQSLDLQSDNKTFDFGDDAATQTALDGNYADGNYTFQVATPLSGTKKPVVTLTGGVYPDAPHLRDLPAGVDSSADFVVSWDTFNGGTSADFIQLHIEDDQANKIFETPDFGKSGALDGTVQGAVVPKDSLLPGKSYTARIVFQKNSLLDTTSYPGALGVASYASRTYFNLTTAGTPNGRILSLSAVGFANAGAFQYQVQGTSGQKVRIDASGDLRQWISVSSNSLPAGGELDLTDAEGNKSGARFYRAIPLP
jgi:hypothetical protein